MAKRGMMAGLVLSAGLALGGICRADEPIPSGALPEASSREARQIKEFIAEFVDVAMSSRGPRGLSRLVALEDRERIGREAASEDQPDARVLRVRQAWRDKYRRSFEIGDQPEVFDGAQVHSDGRRAVLTLPRRQNQPTLHLHLLKEKGDWRLDIPDAMNRYTLMASPGLGASRVEVKKAALSNDIHEAYRFAAHELLMPYRQPGSVPR